MTCSQLHKLLLSEGILFEFNSNNKKYSRIPIESRHQGLPDDQLFVAYDSKRHQIINNQLTDNWEKDVFTNGIYLMFECEQIGHLTTNQPPYIDRIVYVGINEKSSTPQEPDKQPKRSREYRRLFERLKNHFTSQGKNTKLRDHIEECLYASKSNMGVTQYMQTNLRFMVIKVDDATARRNLEAKLISTIARCEHCNRTADWLGQYSSNKTIANGKMWNVEGVNAYLTLDEADEQLLAGLVRNADLPQKQS